MEQTDVDFKARLESDFKAIIFLASLGLVMMIVGLWGGFYVASHCGHWTILPSLFTGFALVFFGWGCIDKAHDLTVNADAMLRARKEGNP